MTWMYPDDRHFGHSFPNAALGAQPAKQKNPATLQMRARLVPDSERISELFLCRIPK